MVITVYTSVFWKHMNGLTSDLFNINVTSGNKLSKSHKRRRKDNIFIYIKVEILFRIFLSEVRGKQWIGNERLEIRKKIVNILKYFTQIKNTNKNNFVIINNDEIAYITSMQSYANLKSYFTER